VLLHLRLTDIIMAMAEPPRYLCPRCGYNLRTVEGEACPECGFFIGPARVQHRGAVRYWRYLRWERRWDILVIVLWFVALVLGYWVISLSPELGLKVITVIAGAGVVGLGHYLQLRHNRKSRN
jgi:ribosomal protein L37E